MDLSWKHKDRGCFFSLNNTQILCLHFLQLCLSCTCLNRCLKQRAGNCFSHSCLSVTDLCFSGINDMLVHIALIMDSMVPTFDEPKGKAKWLFSLQFITTYWLSFCWASSFLMRTWSTQWEGNHRKPRDIGVQFVLTPQFPIKLQNPRTTKNRIIKYLVSDLASLKYISCPSYWRCDFLLLGHFRLLVQIFVLYGE